MKAPKTELFEVRFNSYSLPNGDKGYNRYVLGVPYVVAEKEITPVKISLLKDRVHITFQDGGKHIIFYGHDTELFYRPVIDKKEITEAEETKNDTTE